MSKHRRGERSKVPGWFPFALVASGMIAIGAGIRSGFKTRADASTPPPPPPNPNQPPISTANFP